jgi:WD40 repeat protein
MSSDKRNSKFYVVGGPVQPGRESCILRDSDMQLYARLTEGDYCHVLAPSHEGKTTLMAQTAGRMRAEGIRVATIDLAQISSRDLKDDVGRWYYSFAYRIVRELRIRSDLQTWWQERSGLTIMQRLREFFLEVVLADTDEPVVIFIDRIEAALGHAIAHQLLAAIRACYDARATEPGYQRLTFAMLGSVSVGQRIPDGHDSPFDISTAIELDDFELPELRRLAVGLGADQQTTARMTQAVWDWTRGQPYLSQKVFRALARRTNAELTEELVDEVVETLFISPGGPREEPHLSAVSQEILRESAGRSARLSLYRRIRKGSRIEADPGIDIHRDLLLTGLVVIGAKGTFLLRNRLYEVAFTPQWISRHQPFGWQGAAIAAAVALICVVMPIWYTQYLPQPYIKVLTASNQDYVTALESYRRLSFLPGYGDMADNLFADYLVRQSRRSRRLAEVERFSESLTEIPGRPTVGTQILADFWERRVASSMQRGERDVALLYATRMLDEPTPERRRLVAELLGSDFDKLRGTVRTQQPLRAIELDPVSGLVTTLDTQHRVEVLHVADSGLQRVQQFALLAEEVIPLQRRLVYQGGASGKRLVLTIRTDHLRPADVTIGLRAPSGREVELGLAQGTVTEEEGVYRFASRQGSALGSLLEENINGTWTATFIDNIQGVSGNLLGWEVRIDNSVAELPAGAEQEMSVIPEPGVARQMNSVLSSGGRRALTWPSDPLVRGDLLVWDVANGEILARIPRPANFMSARFAKGHDTVFITAGSTIEFHSISTAQLLTRMAIEPSFTPVLSENGRFLIVDTVLREGDNALSVWDLDAVAEIGRLVTGTVAELVAADPQGRFMAVSDGDRLVRLWSVRDGKLIGEFEHAARPVAIKFDLSGRWLMTQDAAFGFRAWSVDDPRPVLTRRASSTWNASVSGDSLLLGSLDRGFELIDLASGYIQGGVFGHGIPAARKDSSRYKPTALLASDHGFAVTYDGQSALKFWRLPPQLAMVSTEEASSAVRHVAPDLPTIGSAAAVSPDGRHIALATIDGDVRILPVDKQALVLPSSGPRPNYIGHLDPIVVVTFNSTGNLVASGSLDGSIRVWETVSGSPHSFFSGHADGTVHDLVFSADDRFIFSSSRRSVIVIDALNGDLLAQAQIQGERPRLAVSPDGQRVYIAGDRGGLTRWIWRSDIIERLIAPASGIRLVAVDQQEKLLATVDKMNQVRLWDIASMVPRESRVRTATSIDYLSISAKGGHVFAQSGNWINLLEIAKNGLHFASTRLLQSSPSAVALAEEGIEAYVLTQMSASMPRVERIQLMTPAAEPIDEPVEQLVTEIESRLSLTLDEWGDAQPLYRR